MFPRAISNKEEVYPLQEDMQLRRIRYRPLFQASSNRERRQPRRQYTKSSLRSLRMPSYIRQLPRQSNINKITKRQQTRPR